LNDSDRQRPWSKYSKESSAFIKHNPEAKAVLKATNKAKKKESIEERKEKKLERLVGQLKDDKEFIEFLAANKAIKTKENIWKNDIINPQLDTENKSSDMIDVPIESKIEDNKQNDAKNTTKQNDDDADFENGRLYVRNLHYGCKEEDLEILFKPYGPLVEVNMPIDTFSKKPKGFAHITCMFPEKALKAFNDLDGKVFQGRMLHILPGKTKEDPSEADAISEGMNFKKKKELELKKKAQSNHNWNSLFINSDSVANLMSARYNVEKSQIFDVHSSVSKNKAGNSIAVKLAVGETQIVNDMRKFLIRNGVKLDALGSNSTQRSKTVILIKNLPNNTNEEEVRELLKKQGINDMKRLVMPEFGIACLVEFSERQEARDAFKKLAYKKFKTGPLYLEWAPEDIFEGDTEEKEKLEKEEAEEKRKEAEVNIMCENLKGNNISINFKIYI
jgi:multiple RNA-binding domain-containing protein 1